MLRLLRAFVTRLSLDETLLNGVLCFMLFAGSINVNVRTLGEEKWVILALAIGATLIAAGLIGVAICLAVAMGTQQPTAMDAVVMFLREVLGGVGLGLAASVLMHRMLVRCSDYGTHVLISLAVVSLGYGLAEHLEVSGPIAMVVTGLVVVFSIIFQGLTISHFFKADKLKGLLADS